MKKVMLVELFSYHSECLYSQIKFLRYANVDLTLVVDERLKKIVEELELGIDILTFDFKKFSSLLKLRQLILKNGIDLVILNTMQGSVALKFSLLPFPKRIAIVGTLHDTSKLESSTGQKIISCRLNRFYTLSKYIRIPNIDNREFQSVYFNPCYFKEYEVEPLDKKDDIWITIPGSISLKRRDYDVLVKIAKYNKLNRQVKFILLGNMKKQDGEQLWEKIGKEGVKNRFITFDQFIPDSTFHSYLKMSDYLLPLIHPDTPAAKQYVQNKISGVFPLSQAYAITMLCHQMFSAVEGFDYPALFYQDVDQCVELINGLKKAEDFESPAYEEDRDRYLSLIGLV